MSEPNQPTITCDICRQQLPVIGLEADGDMQEHYCISGYTVLVKSVGVVRALSANQRMKQSGLWGSRNPQVVPKFVIAIGPCAACGQPSQGNHAIHRDGMGEGPEVPLCGECGSAAGPTCEQLWERIRVRRRRTRKLRVYVVLFKIEDECALSVRREAFEQMLMSFGEWWTYLPNSFIIKTNLSTSLMDEKLRSVIHYNTDRYLIAELANPGLREGWLAQDAHEWLNLNLKAPA